MAANTAVQPELEVNPQMNMNAQSMVQHQGGGSPQNNALAQKAQDDKDLESRLPHWRTYDETGRRYPVRESRIKDRPNYTDATQGSVKIKVELDLEVEVDLYARVKGDVTVGLM
ncbi:hypothetical protein F5884DRAFT_304194 [Xylogone sp. PMI_703]|nr:hypothetical protein F5884DRAFT_304194 [Xylogone sp. PMI_703]